MELETLNVYRGPTDRYGNPNKDIHGTVDGAFAWGGLRFGGTIAGGKAESSSASPQLYVRRGADLKYRDRVERANGETYVVGRCAWDQDFPLDGYDFGYVVFELEAGNL
ncbi:hypothetical protein CG716_05375 [Mycolicibacterium sphagni]|uniref:Head-tail adaptor protein n=1 Tax=Mycolicibacterium sphagni TaxID=1786 RepID=A0A255DRA5_9MYCO|nr:hypothetical protein CG716_05375 [Mycolicibacterium sphagni]